MAMCVAPYAAVGRHLVKQLLRGGAGTGTGTGWKECGVDLELVVARW